MAHPKGSRVTKTAKSVRVRSRPLAEIDEAKLAVALAMMARRLLEERTTEQLTLRGPPSVRSGEEAA